MRQTIYKLTDPRTGRPRYVGKTRCRLAKRMGEHWSARRKATPVGRWLQELDAQGLRPLIEPLEEFDDGDSATEDKWIWRLRKDGESLLNRAQLDYGLYIAHPGTVLYRGPEHEAALLAKYEGDAVYFGKPCLHKAKKPA